MGNKIHKHPGEFKLRIVFLNFFSYFFFFSAKMNLTVFAGILLAINMATARRASLGEKTMQADEPEEAMRESARPVEKIMRAADKADEPDEAKRAAARLARLASLVEKNMRAADEAGEPAGAKRANGGCFSSGCSCKKHVNCYWPLVCRYGSSGKKICELNNQLL